MKKLKYSPVRGSASDIFEISRSDKHGYVKAATILSVLLPVYLQFIFKESTGDVYFQRQTDESLFTLHTAEQKSRSNQAEISFLEIA